MTEHDLIRLLKKLRRYELPVSTLFGIIALGSLLYVGIGYLPKLRTQTALHIGEGSPSPLLLIEALPDTPIPDRLPVQYVVHPGDSTWKIAQAFYGNGFNYTDIEQANHLEPNQKLETREKLLIPAAPVRTSEPLTSVSSAKLGRTHVTSANDTLWNLAQRYYNNGNKWTVIYEANKKKIADPDQLVSGIKLSIP